MTIKKIMATYNNKSVITDKVTEKLHRDGYRGSDLLDRAMLVIRQYEYQETRKKQYARSQYREACAVLGV